MNTVKRERSRGKRKSRILFVFIVVLILVTLVNGLYLLFGILSRQDTFVKPGFEPDTVFAKESSEYNMKEVNKRFDVDMIWQNPELPNGCEATSLCMALTYLGYETSKEEVAYSYVPREGIEEVGGTYYGPNPDEKYAGDPATSLGFYCTAAPIVEGANLFLQERGAQYTALNISGSSEADIDKWLSKDMPIVIWVTMDYVAEAYYHDNFTWETEEGYTYYPYSNLHCVLLTGFSDTVYYINDPIEGKLEIQKDTLISSYEALGSYAVAFTNDGKIF